MARIVESKVATQKWVASAGGGRLYIAGSDSNELWSCALDDPASATLVGEFPSGLSTPVAWPTSPEPLAPLSSACAALPGRKRGLA